LREIHLVRIVHFSRDVEPSKTRATWDSKATLEPSARIVDVRAAFGAKRDEGWVFRAAASSMPRSVCARAVQQGNSAR